MPNVLLTTAQFLAQPVPVAVPPNVHPMTRPPLTVTRVIKQTFRGPLVPIVRTLVLHSSDFFCRGRHSDEIQIKAPQQKLTRGLALRGQSVLRVPLEDKGINWIFRPGYISTVWHSRADARPKGPVLFWIGFAFLL